MWAVLGVFGIIVGVVAVSTALGRVFGKYIDLRRQKFGQTAHKISGSVEGLEEEILALQERNDALTAKIERMEALVTSPEWDIIRSAEAEQEDTSEKTLGRSRERTS